MAPALRRCLSTATLATAFLLTLPVHAYCRTTTCDAKKPNAAECETDPNGCAARGIPIYWPKRCIPLAAHAEGSEVLGYSAEQLHEITLNAADEWTNASCSNGSAPSVRFVDAGPVECGDVEYNPGGPNANIVIARDSTWTHSFEALAVTTVTFRSKTGEILNSDIELNSELIVSSDLVSDLKMVITHELGHALGLSHSNDVDAIMFAKYNIGRAATGLERDDIEGVCAVYPPGRIVPECDAMKDFDARCGGNVIGGCSVPQPQAATPGSGNVVSWGAGLLAASALACFARRRGRRRDAQRVRTSA